MKQRITIGQLNKLTDAHKERLREWWKPQAFDHYANQNMEHFFVGYTVGDDAFVTYGDDIPHGKEGMLPLLTIGQMIQLIEEKRPIKGISKNRFDKWFINIETAQLGYKDELCDSLWEATIQFLKEEKK